MKKSFFMGILLLGLFSSLLAFPFANYGNIRVPDAYVMPHTMARLTVMNYFTPETVLQTDDLSYVWGSAVNVGLFDYGELGFVYTADKVFYGHLKGNVIKETATLPDISVGIDNLFSRVEGGQKKFKDVADPGGYRRNSIYLAISKVTMLSGIPVIENLPARITVGAGSNRFVGTTSFSRDFTGIFGAIQFEVYQNLVFMNEIDGHNFNSALEYTYNNISGKFIMYRIEEWSRGSHRGPKLGLSVSYLFDKHVQENLRGGLSFSRNVETRQATPQLIDVRRDSPALDELQRIRRQRERAEQELQEIRRLLED